MTETTNSKNLQEEFDLKASLRLPQTDFPMKAQLPQREPSWVQFWKEQKIYEQQMEKNAAAPIFCMTDGPPYANGSIHLGTALNKVLKDVVVKYKNMKSFHAAFVPGWDCHGLPIELKVSKQFKNKTDSEIRSLCRKEAHKWIKVQKAEFQRLGVMADWDKPYLTLNPQYEADEVRLFSKIYQEGLICRDMKPVYWCTKLGTALAASEVEYKNHKSSSIYVKFYLKEPLEGRPTSFVIWTTTPWTLPANQAICLNPSLSYGLYEIEGEHIVIACDRKTPFESDTGKPLALVKTLDISSLERSFAQHPFMNRDSMITFGDHVTLDSGTGCVHTAPSHGVEDHEIGVKYKLPMDCPVGPYGKFTGQAGPYADSNIHKATPQILTDLAESGHLISQKEIEHSYPYNPRVQGSSDLSTHSPMVH